MAETQGGSTPTFLDAVAAAKSSIAEANAVTDANLESQAAPAVAPVVDPVVPDVLEHTPTFADKAKEADSPFLFEDVAEKLITPNPFGGVGQDKETLDQYVTVEGLEHPIQVSELVKGYLMQADYTRKTQALAEQRKQFEVESAAASKLFKALQDDPAGTVASLAVEVKLIAESDLSADILSRINRDHRVPNREEMESTIAERAKALVESDPRIVDAEDAQIRAQVEASFSGIEETHSIKLSDRDKDLILQQAVEMQTMRLDLAYLDLMTRAEKLRAERKTVTQAAPASAATPGRTDEKVLPDTKATSIREAWARTKSAQ